MSISLVRLPQTADHNLYLSDSSRDVLPTWLEEQPTLAFLALAILTNFDRFLLGSYAPIRFHDTFDGWFVALKTTGTSLLTYGLQAWSPYVVGGVPAYATALQPLFIGNLMAAILPLWLVYAVFKTTAVFVAGYGMFRYLKLFLATSPLACLFGGVLYTAVGYLEQNSHISAWGFPLFFVWVCTLIGSERKASRIFFVLGIAVILFNTPPHVTIPFYPVLHLALLYIHFQGRDLRDHLVGWALVWTGYVLLNAPLLYGILSFAPDSHRATWSPETYVLPSIMSAVYGVLRDSYFSLPFLVLAPFAWKHSNRLYVKRLALLTAGTLLLMVLFYSRYRSLILNVFPFIYVQGGNIVQKITFLPFLMTVLASIGFAVLTHKSNRINQRLFWIIPVTSFAVAYRYVAMPGLSGIQRYPVAVTYLVTTVLFLSGALMLALLARYTLIRRSFICLILLLAVPVSSRAFDTVFFELRVFNETFSKYSPLASLPRDLSHPYRTVFVGQELNVASEYHGLETLDGYTNMYPMTFKEFWIRLISKQLENSQRTRDYYLPRGSRVYLYTLYDRMLPAPHDFEDVRASLPLLSLASVKYVVSPLPLSEKKGIFFEVGGPPGDDFPVGGFETATNAFKSGRIGNAIGVLRERISERKKIRPIYIYEQKDGFNRAFLVQDWLVLDTDSAVLERLTQASVDMLRRRAFLSRERGEPVPPAPPGSARSRTPTGDSSTEIVKYTPDRIQITTIAPQPSLLVVSNNFHPKWRAIVNGSFQPVYRADHTFQAVWVPEGKSRVTLEYHDPTLWLLHGLIPIGLFMILVPLFVSCDSKVDQLSQFSREVSGTGANL